MYLSDQEVELSPNSQLILTGRRNCLKFVIISISSVITPFWRWNEDDVNSRCNKVKMIASLHQGKGKNDKDFPSRVDCTVMCIRASWHVKLVFLRSGNN